MKRFLPILLICIGLIGCAQVPREAVELSATVGRDMAEMQRAHVAFIDLYYNRLTQDIDRFIDDVYAPYQIRKTLSDPVWKDQMLSAVRDAAEYDRDGRRQKEGLAKIEIFLEVVRGEIETYRQLKKAPVIAQHESLLQSVNQAYERIHYANSIVTGHLASVVKVHDTQDELLAMVDLQDLRQKVSERAAGVSEKIAELIVKGQKAEEKTDELIKKFNEIMKRFDHKE